MVPAEDVYANEWEHPSQWWQNLFGDVVGSVQPQVGVLQDLDGPPHQLYEGQPRHAVHDDVGHSLPDPWLRAPVVGQHPPVGKQPLECTRRQSQHYFICWTVSVAFQAAEVSVQLWSTGPSWFIFVPSARTQNTSTKDTLCFIHADCSLATS